MSDVKFSDPPRGYAHRIDHKAVAEQLKARPGEWGEVPTHGNANSTRSMAHHIRTGTAAAYSPAGHFEAVSRKASDGSTRLWARYIGKPANTRNRKASQ